MANYTIPIYPAQRLRYYNNQFLKDQDFIDDQRHRLAMAQAQLRALCVAGVCEGLTLRKDASNRLQVAPGVAIDSAGHLIALDAEKAGPDASSLPDGEYVLHISFQEDEDVMAPPVAGGASGNTRWTQRPLLGAARKGSALPALAVALGTFTVAQAVVTTVSSGGRRYSGIRLPGPDPASAATIANRNDGSADGALMTGDLTVRRDLTGTRVGPTFTLVNGATAPGTPGSGASIDFAGYDPGSSAPALRLQAVTDDAHSSHLTISTKQRGAITNNLVERLRVTSTGVLQFSNDAPKDKVVVYEASESDRYGIGLNAGNLNLFYPPGGRFSLRISNSAGTEVLSVNSGGSASFAGKINASGYVPTAAALNAPSLEIGSATPMASGANGGVVYLHHHSKIAHQLRYENGTLNLEAAGNGYGTNNTPNLRVGGAVSWGDSDTRTESRSNAGLRGDAGARSGFFQTNTPQNFPPGASSWWHLLDVRHSNPANNYALQLAGSFSDQRLWFRKVNDNPAQAWREAVSADASGNVSISSRLSVSGALSFSNSNWNSYGAEATIINDNVDYRALMIVGSNQNQGHNRWVRMWDDVQVERHLNVSGDLQLSGKHALRGNDAWLRLNQDGAFVGTHTPGLFAPNSINVGAAGGSWNADPGGGQVWLAGNIGTAGHHPSSGGHFPSGWGGGVHTWDIVAEATVGYSSLKQWSSIRDKTDIRDLRDALATLEQLRPAVYLRSGEPRAGFIAEEVREIYAYGAEPADDMFCVGIAPDALLALTVAALQELSDRVTELSLSRQAERSSSAPLERRIELLREGTHEGKRYATARFFAAGPNDEPRTTVRTVELPDDGDRDDYLAIYYDAWRRRVEHRREATR